MIAAEEGRDEMVKELINHKANRIKTQADNAAAKAEAAQTKAQVGWLELQLRVYLSSRRDKIHDCTRDLEATWVGEAAKADPALVARLQSMKKRFVSANEDFLNALEQACRHYRDEKVEKEAFRRMYGDEVNEAIKCPEGHPFHKSIHPEGTSKYQAIWAVYREWFIREGK